MAANQFRPAPPPEHLAALRQWERAIEWIDDNASYSPLGDEDHLKVRQCFAVTINMADYPTTATRFIDAAKDDDGAQNNLLLLLVFLYLVNAMWVRTSIASAREESLDDEDDSEAPPARKAPGRRRTPQPAAAPQPPAEDPEDGVNPAPKRRRLKAEPRFDAMGAILDVAGPLYLGDAAAAAARPVPEDTAQEARVQKLIRMCRQRGIPLDDIDGVEELAERAEILSSRIMEQIETEEETPRHWFAVEYVPDREYDSPEKSFVGDIFGNDKYAPFNNLMNRKRTRYWTFHFLTTATYDFNRELGKLLAKNLYSEFSQPESTVGLTPGQKRHIEQRICGTQGGSYVIGAAEMMAAELAQQGTAAGNKRKRTNDAAREMQQGGAAGGAQYRKNPNQYSLFVWRKYEQVTPQIMVSLASNYLGVNVRDLYDKRGELVLPAAPTWSPIHACNIFSELQAIRRRAPDDVSDMQSIYKYSERGTYFMPTIENQVMQDAPTARRALMAPRHPYYYWRPPFKNRLIFMRVEQVRPATVILKKFPDQTILAANPFATLFPSLTAGRVQTAAHRRMFSGVTAAIAAATGAEVVMHLDEPFIEPRDGSPSQARPEAGGGAGGAPTAACAKKASGTPAFPIFPRIRGVLYKDIEQLQSKIERSRIALADSMRRVATNDSYMRRISSGALFAAHELEAATIELDRFRSEFALFDRWNQANLRAMEGYGEVLGDFVSEMAIANNTELEKAMATERPRFGERIKPAAPFQISEFLAGPANNGQNYEIFNTLRDRNTAFLKILRPFLDDATNGLTPKDRCCLYKIYQMHAMRTWDMMARGSDSFLPDAAREVYKYIEQNDAYNPVKRPRNIMRKMDQRMDILSNSLAWFLSHYRVTLSAARPELLQLAVLATYDASRPFYDIHLNICFAGEGGVAKSWTFMMATTLRIPKTHIEVTGETAAANRTSSGAKENWNVVVHHEIERRRFVGDNEGGVGDPVTKQILDRGISITRTVILNKVTNDVENHVRIMERVCANFWCANFALDSVHNSMFDRTIVINMPPSDKVVAAIFIEQTKHRSNDEHYQTQLYLHRWIQAVMHEVWMAVGLAIVPPPSATLLFVAMQFINERMIRAGIRPFRPREILKFRLLGCNLVLLNAVITNFLVQGGRYYNQPVTVEAVVSLAPQLYMTSTQVIQTIKILSPYFIMHGEDQLRRAFLYMADQRKRATNSAASNYMMDNEGSSRGSGRIPSRNQYAPTGSRGGGDFNDFSAGAGADDDLGPFPSSNGIPDSGTIDWNYHKFHVNIVELMNFIRIQPGGDSLTQHEVLMTINDLCKRNIRARPYVRRPMAHDSDEPMPAEPMPGEVCPCTTTSGSPNSCKKHGPREVPIIKERHNGRDRLLIVSTAWLMTEKSCSAEAVIHEALYDFFNHRHQPSIHCTTDYSSEFPGTFNTMSIVAPDPRHDRRPIFEVPNLHKLTEQEHRFMHERGRSYEADEAPIDDEEFDLWIADRFSLREPFDVYAALAHRKLLYPYSEGKVTQRDLVKVLYSVGHKLGWVDEKSPLWGMPFDPDDPLLTRYDDEHDLDVPDNEFLVPSSDGPRGTMTPLRVEMDMTLPEFKMSAFTPDTIELRQDLHEAHNSCNTLVGKYPDDLRSALRKSTSGSDDAPTYLDHEPLTLSLTKQLSVTEHEIAAINKYRHNVGRRRANLRAEMFARANQQPSPMRDRLLYMSPAGTPSSLMSSPNSSYTASPSVASKSHHGSPHQDSCHITPLMDLLRDDLVSPLRYPNEHRY